ncbi:hypothetical protein [Calothrix sp. UHCC 0171]|uniref:hypothetical protein n=1 Tax=Calothrix sp. UHCC 0171 TaxID=3110245 RepID=UPI002B1F0E44|nr:hypothetical protein [Calothrix sp. UHCC 0171]MEA5570940.1 hypothetical protein [Calothrix sp. UHCC 0171]
MYKYTTHLLALGLVASSAMVLNPCYAQTATQSRDGESSNLEKLPAVSQGSSESENNSSQDKSVLSSDTVSQASPESTTVANSNPRIPISSRIFPTMQQ